MTQICLDRLAPHLQPSLTGSLNLMKVVLRTQRASFGALPQEVECTSITGACWTLAEVKSEKQQK